MAEPFKDPYEVLGVPRTATDAEIRRAYRKLAHQFHPDVNPGNKKAEERFKEIAAAHEALSTPDKRKLFDEFGEASLRPGFNAEQARAYREAAAGYGGARGFGGVDFDPRDLFGDLLGGDFFGGLGGSSRRRPAETLAQVDIDFMQALHGVEVVVPVNRAVECPTCNGSGRIQGKQGCPTCRAAGQVLREERVTVRIPPGADNGSRLRVPASALHGAGADVVIETRVRPHPHFRRDGLNLHLMLPVTVDEAYNGGRISVPTPEGVVEMRVPPRSQSGTRLRLKSKGVARGNVRGDLYVELSVKLPQRDDPQFAAAARAASAEYGKTVREGISL